MSEARKNRIFLDYASTTPVDPRVFEAMKPYFSERFENPSALYKEGVEAKKAIDDARLSVARSLGCLADEIIFTGSGTESDNMAILGTIRAASIQNQQLGNLVSKLHVVTTTIEHPAVMEACRALESDGVAVTYVPVGEDGIVKAEDVSAAVTEHTVLVSVMLANNEIGTIQPVGKIAKLLKEKRDDGTFPYFHVDASQAPNYIDASVLRLGCDLMTLDGSKIYGPKGVGMLFVRRGVEFAPLMFGGGQEKGLRPGTENVAGIVGFAKALELTLELRESESARLSELRDYMIDEVQKKIPGAILNGSREERLPNNVNICFPNLDGEFAVIQLDAKGIACSSASSCKNLSASLSSYVIEALGKRDCASSSLRFTMGRETTKEEISQTIEAIDIIVNK